MRPQNQFIQDTLYHYSKDSAIEQRNFSYQDDQENDREMKPIFESDENCTFNSCSTINSVSDEESDESPEIEPKETTSARLNTLINILKDDCFKTDNIININRPIKPEITINDEKPKIPRMDWDNYHRLDVIHSFLDDLEYDYPSICTTGAIGKSVEGRDLKILKISNSDSTNSSIWIDAGIHAREWIAPAVATYVANHIVKNFNDMPPSVTSKDWYFLPVVNPDGYEYSHTVDRMWRKSRSWYGGECVGVDLNRNFSCGWGGKGSSGIPTNVFYRGPEPFSEPESSAVRDMLINAGISFKVYITLHSYGQVIIFPFAHKEDLCPDYIRLLEGATVMSKVYPWNTGLLLDGVQWRMSPDSQRDPSVDWWLLMTAVTAAITIWKEERSTMDIMVERSRAGQVAGMLHEREIPYSVAIADVGLMLSRERGGTSTKVQSPTLTSTRSRLSIDWKNYYRLSDIYNFMDKLAAEFPYLCSIHVIGSSVEGRDIKLLKISNGNDGNAGVWLDGGIHPREWISTAVVTFIANKIVRTFHRQPDSVTNKNWYILPVMNPDGYEYTHTHDRMWRKNRAKYGECVGVDLNRNFSYGWGEKGEEGSSEDPGNIFYRGPKPFSEPETLAVKKAVLESETTFQAFLSFHSYGEVVIFPWGYTGDPCPDYVELLEGGTAIAKAIHDTSGRTYKVGSTKDLMYFSAGTSIDWSYGVANIPYSYMIELRAKEHRFLLPKEEIQSTATEVYNGVMRLMDFIDRRCKATGSSISPK